MEGKLRSIYEAFKKREKENTKTALESVDEYVKQIVEVSKKGQQGNGADAA